MRARATQVRERRYLSVVALRKEDYERLGVNGTQEGATYLFSSRVRKPKRLMAFVNDPLFLVVAEVTLNYIRRERGGAVGSKIIYSVRDDYAKYRPFYCVLSVFISPGVEKRPQVDFTLMEF